MSKQTHKILIVDDDQQIRVLMQRFLMAYGLEVIIAQDAPSMDRLIEKHSDLALICLDVMLPGEDGFRVLQRLRLENNIPIMMLTAVGEDAERIMGLELGADDYLTKPFNPHELLARIKAILRRKHREPYVQKMPVLLRFLGWVLDKTHRRLISPDGLEITLTDSEYRLLEAFADRPNRILSRDDLLEITQNRHAGPFDRSIDVRISRLRQKIEPDVRHPKVIKTVRGGGYIFAAQVDTSS